VKAEVKLFFLFSRNAAADITQVVKVGLIVVASSERLKLY
jgi:hypothetical protein